MGKPIVSVINEELYFQFCNPAIDDKGFAVRVDKVFTSNYVTGVIQALIDSTIDEALDVAIPYKKYVALLTQTGASNNVAITSGPLVVGTTYEITDYVAGDDFTNVGAASNETGVIFCATGTTPTVYTEESELTYDEGAPVVIVLENTLDGESTWSYDSQGNYRLTNTGAFTDGKVNVFMSQENGVKNNGIRLNANVVQITSADISGGTEFPDDGYLSNTSIEVRVYN